MATFLTSLWESVFTPGPTPTLLIATNVTFGSLQILFLSLLIATHSFHFIALSILSAGLWWAINWFAAELARAKDIEEQADRIRRKRRSAEMPAASDDASGAEADPESEEEGTETEREKTPAPPAAPAPRIHVRGGTVKIQGVMESARRAQQVREEFARQHAQQEGGSATGAKLKPADAGEASKRRSLGESNADLSSSTTDSEWEKVSEGGDR